MTETSIDQVTGLVIHVVFSLADKDIEEVRQTDDTNITESEREISRSKVIEEVRPADDTGITEPESEISHSKNAEEELIEKVVKNSPVPIKKCSVRVIDIIEEAARNSVPWTQKNVPWKQKVSNTVDHVISDNANKTENCGCVKTVSKGSMSVIECECSMSYDAGRQIGRERKPHSLLTGDYLYQDADILKYEELVNKQKQNQDAVEKKKYSRD